MLRFLPSETVDGWRRPPFARAPATRWTAAAEPSHHSAAAILFADIVGFTRLCEALPPRSAFDTLHGFHDRMLRLLAAHGAAVTDAIGDGVMGVWTAVDGGRNAARALQCGFAMLATVKDWGDEHVAQAGGLSIGVGLHLGPVAVGRTGGPLQTRHSAFGDTVNVAARLERLTRRDGAAMVASEVLLQAAATVLPCDRRLAGFGGVEEVGLRGRETPVAVRRAA